MIKIVVDVENKTFELMELGKHSLDLDKIKSDIQKIMEAVKTKEDAYLELGYWQFELPDNIQEQIIVDIKEVEKNE
ncbi:MAG: hypothetical protein JHC31_14785 [Sulfurihydrogenibium sp.]|nr:hypothetical protein [Sulfurihydrogenibium sp.]